MNDKFHHDLVRDLAVEFQDRITKAECTNGEMLQVLASFLVTVIGNNAGDRHCEVTGFVFEIVHDALHDIYDDKPEQKDMH